ncbi:inositol monophosphatase family protein [Alterisphingorhabdus coralli]|uniref:Inositol monophosphatase family protein n=1 Tax=Alterisphingorhabdus coralli TaxID=3071408 RepID=A0AA97HZ20_9SPHN|nr:inositol monophosphatase family protein [Parasphingorhabdus sp. SCSIO 66989]WOE74119.1 inositol monophosphatase family protein [Parasphingorhabdus sp. SCSIO 66989]
MAARPHPLDRAVTELLRQVADDLVMPYFRNLGAADIAEKSPGDLVTKADQLSEEALHQGLAKLLPDAVVVGEEACESDPSLKAQAGAPQAWIIDPIDGTGNYAAGNTPFGMIVALAENNRTIAGWIYDPVRKRICHAHYRAGAFIDSEQVRISSNLPERPNAALAMRYMTEQQREKALAIAEEHYELMPIPNCSAEQYLLLVQRQHHLTIFERTLPWDHAAGVLFLNEAGGKAARWDGSEYRPGDDRKGMLGASNPAIWEQAVELFERGL